MAEVLERLPLLQEMTDQPQALSTRQPRSAFWQREAEAGQQKPKPDGREDLGVEAQVEGMPVVVALTGKVIPERADTQVGARVEVEALRQPAQVRQPLNQTAALDTHGSTAPPTAAAEEGRMAVLLAAASVAPEAEVPRVSIRPRRARSTPEGEEEGLGLTQPQQAARAAPALSSSPFRDSCNGSLR